MEKNIYREGATRGIQALREEDSEISGTKKTEGSTKGSNLNILQKGERGDKLGVSRIAGLGSADDLLTQDGSHTLVSGKLKIKNEFWNSRLV